MQQQQKKPTLRQYEFKADFNGQKAFISGTNLEELTVFSASSFDILTPIKLSLKVGKIEYPITNQMQFETTIRNIKIDKSTELIVRLVNERSTEQAYKETIGKLEEEIKNLTVSKIDKMHNQQFVHFARQDQFKFLDEVKNKWGKSFVAEFNTLRKGITGDNLQDLKADASRQFKLKANEFKFYIFDG